jgi:hypothetical protein
MKTITRSHGYIPRFKNGGIILTPVLPGGGYEGETKELDDAVAHAAELLKNATDHDIEIRFNSHRRSGGAYLKGIEPSIGIGAGLNDKGKLYIDVYCGREWLKNQKEANNETYFFDHFENAEYALLWIQSHVNIPSKTV